MRYLPHTDKDIASMLEAVGAESLDDLFSVIPKDCLFSGKLDLPEPMTEWELSHHMAALAGENAGSEYIVFMGAGSYEHHIPASVSYLLGRSEFSTAYTPYQPEISQGTLQAIYEYQTLATQLLGMEVANASLYDGATALAEALLMAIRITRRRKIAISGAIHPLYRQVVRTYLEPAGHETIELDYLEGGRTNLAALKGVDELAAVAVQSPNFFGIIENLQAAADMTSDDKTLLVAAFTEPLAYGMLKNPGEQGADIACGEAQSLGIPQSFGGPGLGMFACKKSYMRNMPGRLVGQTVDADGKRGFVLTLATREQHIRREKATSNICTNNSLCALASAMYMASLGGSGFRRLAALNYDKSEYLKSELIKAGCTLAFDGPTFNEFVVEFPGDSDGVHARLLENKIVAGIPLAAYYPELAGKYLLCVTEARTRSDMDSLVAEVRE
jgi:glycine dehydrogenase subunit 1